MGTPKNPSINDIGKRYGRLVVVQVSNHSGKVYACCRCDCGTEKEVRLDSVRSGRIVSCGCRKREHLLSMRETHKMSGTPTYSSWQHMKARCKPSNIEKYPHHAGKGVSICQRWLESFENFYEDMGDCPNNHTLDRIDSNGDYTPENCRWAEGYLQGFNKNGRGGKQAGVNFRKDRGKWAAQICHKGKVHHLGCFMTYEEALKVRIEAEIQFYGETSIKTSTQ